MALLRSFSILAVLLSSCATDIEYLHDPGFMTSGEASPEYPVMINGYLCKDIEKRAGNCATSVLSGKVVTVELFPQQYNYRLVFSCSKGVGIDQTVDVRAKESYYIKIDHNQYKDKSSFICIGQVFPQDRLDKVSMRWEMRVKIIPREYQSREKMRMYKKGDKYYLLPGIHALYTSVRDTQGKIHHHHQQTQIELSDNINNAWSESYQGRLNYWGY